MGAAKLSITYHLAFYLFVFVNFIFSVKYISRVTDYYLIASILVSGVYVLVWNSGIYFIRYSSLRTINLGLLILFLIICIYGLAKIPVESLQVDRWSVINSFWETYSSGEYAYFAKAHTGNPPGPMPFYFILAFPFFLLGELGWLSLAGVVIFYFLLRLSKIQEHLITLSLLLLFISTFYLWEVFGRSNVFVNSVLVLVVMVFFNRKNKSIRDIVLSGVFTGLVMSTRNVFVIPFIILFLYAIRYRQINMKQFVLMGVISLTVFALTFLPFVWGHFDDFKKMNPFLVQGTFLIPFEYTIGFIGLALVFGLICKSKEDVYLFSGLNLFIAIAVYFIYHFIISGFYNTYFGSLGDVSYFILCVPFLLYYAIIRAQQRAVVSKASEVLSSSGSG